MNDIENDTMVKLEYRMWDQNENLEPDRNRNEKQYRDQNLNRNRDRERNGNLLRSRAESEPKEPQSERRMKEIDIEGETGRRIENEIAAGIMIS
ncbi:hypothetical protein EVAR_90544_1 [Eumeta japonica]|uniref:Uncharacterized protein n=1 Tax=Eumeta variegata TaxID=151549 RepID=A0A4C1XYD3_EUMVA|nr:hypothetical protein EVAR_90544_1 [Eumeta japonica]